MSGHTRIKFSVPKPPSRQNTRDNPEATLPWINKRVHELISTHSDRPAREEGTLDPQTYLVIYSTICDYANVKYPDSLGANLYHDLVEAIRTHCKDLRQKILRGTSQTISGDTAILESFVEEWKRFGALAEIITHLYRYHDRHWVTRQLDQGKSHVYKIADVQEKVFRHEVIIGALKAEQDTSQARDSGEDHVSILDVATRARENDNPASEGTSDHRAPGLLDEVFGIFDMLGFRIIGTWQASIYSHLIEPSLVKQLILPSGLNIIHLHYWDIEPSVHNGGLGYGNHDLLKAKGKLSSL